MAIWTCRETAVSAAHVHTYDEYVLVVQGCYTLIIGSRPANPMVDGPVGLWIGYFAILAA